MMIINRITLRITFKATNKAYINTKKAKYAKGVTVQGMCSLTIMKPK